MLHRGYIDELDDQPADVLGDIGRNDTPIGGRRSHHAGVGGGEEQRCACPPAALAVAREEIVGPTHHGKAKRTVAMLAVNPAGFQRFQLPRRDLVGSALAGILVKRTHRPINGDHARGNAPHPG